MIEKKVTRTLEDFEADISVNLPLGLKPPTILLGEDDYQSISDIYTRIAKYRAPGWYSQVEITEVQSDVILLQSSLLELLRKHGVLISYADTVEEQLKIVRSKIIVQGKNLKKKYEDNGDVVKVTLTDIKELSIVKTEDIWKELAEHQNAASFVKFIYFAVKDMVSYLDKSVQRMHMRGE